MQIKCSFCGSWIVDTDKKCPHCGAENEHLKRTVDGTPKTIDELKQWYRDRNLPPENTTRFFIGKNYHGAKAFGIYEDNGTFIVYKNKADGSRAVRYQGPDEAYAVNEIYLKLKSEILNQKEANIRRRKGGSGSDRDYKPAKAKVKDSMKGCGISVLAFFVFGLLVFVTRLFTSILLASGLVVVGWIIWLQLDKKFELEKRIKQKKKTKKKYAGKLVFVIWITLILLIFTGLRRYDTPRYYHYDNRVYCYYHHDYYLYDDDYNDYVPVYNSDVPSLILDRELEEITDWESEENWDSNFCEFEDSDYYEENLAPSESSGSSSDSGYDWDSSDSWDSGSSDWDSDW